MDSYVVAVVLMRRDVHALPGNANSGQPADHLVRLFKSGRRDPNDGKAVSTGHLALLIAQVQASAR
jgi:hypothetical protein